LTLSNGQIKSGDDLKDLVKECIAIKSAIEATAKKVGSLDVFEQFLLAGGCNKGMFADDTAMHATLQNTIDRIKLIDKNAGEEQWGLSFENGVAKLTKTLYGVTQEYLLRESMLERIYEAEIQSKIALIIPMFAKPAKYNDKDIKGPVSLVGMVMETGRKGFNIQRYKGLGEMDDHELWETTLNPQARVLLQVNVQHVNDAEEVFSTLMGDVVEPRREFIQENALNVRNLDA
jgi:DNA gyrase subunit B